MAHWMKVWLALVAVGCGLVMIWLLPPDPPRRLETYIAPTEAQAMKVDLMREALRLNDVLKLTRWMDSLTDVLVDAVPTDNGVILSSPGVSEVESELMIQAAGEFDQLRIERAEYHFALARPDRRSGNHAAFKGNRSIGTQFFATEVGDRKVCLALFPERSHILGPCAYYLIHGTPGPSIASWMSSGGARFGSWYGDGAGVLPDGERILRRENVFARFGNQAPFGIRTTPYRMGIHQCLNGDDQACRDAVLGSEQPDPDDVGVAVPGMLLFGNGDSPFYFFEESLLYDLEQEFGREAFGLFWRSDQGIDSAFEAAFGMEIGEWVMGWAQARLGVYHMGPMPNAETIILTLGVISFFLTIAMAMGSRRKVA